MGLRHSHRWRALPLTSKCQARRFAFACFLPRLVNASRFGYEFVHTCAQLMPRITRRLSHFTDAYNTPEKSPIAV
jgi:hypothetical protein